MLDYTKSIQELNQTGSIEEMLWKCSELFPGQVVFSSSLGEEDQILTHLIFQHKIPIQIFSLDTGRLFPETLELLGQTEKKYGNKIQVYAPDASDVESYVNTQGINAFYDSVEQRKACCGIRKVKPLKRALANQAVWITGLRKEQSENRQNLNRVEFDEGFGLIKCNPLLEWSYADVKQYINENNIPYNPLHDKHFLSIGCAPCTRAIEPGEDIRAGRWWWEQSKKECGLHENYFQKK